MRWYAKALPIFAAIMLLASPASSEDFSAEIIAAQRAAAERKAIADRVLISQSVQKSADVGKPDALIDKVPVEHVAVGTTTPPVRVDALVRAFDLAKSNEPVFAGALAERDALMVTSKIAGAALYPEIRVSAAQQEYENFVRKTVTLTQPLLNWERIAVYREREPRETLAQATLKKREFELQLRLFKVLSEYIRSREGRKLNEGKLQALDQQAVAARRLFELGAGTVTDVRDTEVRAEQAKAAALILETRTRAAERQWFAMTGTRIGENGFVFRLREQREPLPVLPLDDYLRMGLASNPQVILDQQNARIGELSVDKAKAAVAPNLNGVITYTEANGISNRFAGLAISVPIQAGGYMSVDTASAALARVREQIRDSEQNIRLEIERLRDGVLSGIAELEIRKNAIKAAQLSVEATERSFKGGVRSHTDLLNAIQVHFQAREEHLGTLLVLAESWTSLQIFSAQPPELALSILNGFLFE